MMLTERQWSTTHQGKEVYFYWQSQNWLIFCSLTYLSSVKSEAAANDESAKETKSSDKSERYVHVQWVRARCTWVSIVANFDTVSSLGGHSICSGKGEQSTSEQEANKQETTPTPPPAANDGSKSAESSSNSAAEPMEH